MKNKLALIALFLSLSIPVHAGFELGRVSHMGDGCPANSVKTIVANDGSSFSILYDNLSAKLEGNAELNKTMCWSTLELKLPGTQQLVIEAVDYRGFYELPDANALAGFHSRFFFDNGAARYANNWYPPNAFSGGFVTNKPGPGKDDVTVTFPDYGATPDGKPRNPNQKILFITPCGGITKLNIQSDVTVMASTATPGKANGYAIFDTADGALNKPSQVYKYKVVECQYKWKSFRPYPVRPNDELKGHLGPIWYE